MSQQTPTKPVLFRRTLTQVVMGVFSVVLSVLATTVLTAPQQAHAATQTTINFQARLEGNGGNIAPDGLYNVRFKIYDALTSGSQLWTEDHIDTNGAGGGQDYRAVVTNGYLSVQLGSQNAFSGINWDQQVFITMTIGGTNQITPSWDTEMSPRLQVTGVPYAFKAGALSTTGTYTSTLSLANPTVGNQTFSVANQGAGGSYTICVQGTAAANGGCAASTGAAGYIQNQNASAQSTSNYWISGSGTASSFLFTNGGNANLVGLQAGTSSAAYTLTLPTTGPSINNCLKAGAVTATSLVFGSCGTGGGGVTLQTDFSGSPDTGHIWIDGTARADTSVETPLLDTDSAVALDIGTNNATMINLNQDVTIAADKSLILTGGTSFPGSPVEGQAFYRTDTNTLYIYDADATRWQADRSSTTLIVAADDSQNKEKADYVADGTDDQDEINTAITDLPATGGKIVLLDGTFNITDPILIDEHFVTLTGMGSSTTLVKGWDQTSAGAGVITIDANQAFVSELNIEGDRGTYTDTDNHGIYKQQDWANTTINGVNIDNMGGTGIYVNGDGALTSRYHKITNNTVEGSGVHGIYAASTFNSVFNDNAVHHNDSYGINVDGGANTISGNTAKTNAIGIGVGSDSVVSGNVVEDNTVIGINVLGSENDVTITGNAVIDNDYGINVSAGGNNISITGNTVTESNGEGINTDSGTAVKWLTITGNTITDNGGSGIQFNGTVEDSTISGNTLATNAGSGSQNAIDLSHGYRTNIIGNRITDTAGSGYAIYISSTSTDNYLADNTYSGTGAATISDAGTGTVYANQDNGSGYLRSISTGIHLQGGTTSTAVVIQAGSGGFLEIGSSDVANTINLGNNGTAGSVAQTLNIGTNSSAGGTNAINIGNSTATASTVNIQGGTSSTAVAISAGSTGYINVGSTGVANTINIGNVGASNAVVQGINIGTNSNATGTNTITIGNSAATASTVSINGGTGASAVTIAAGSTGDITIGATATANNDIFLSGVTTIKPISGSNSTTAFQVQNGAGTSYITGDSTNQIVTTKDLNTGAASNVAAAGRLFSESFEGNSYSLWSTGVSGTVTVDTAQKRNGKYSGKVNPSAGIATSTTNIASNATVAARGYFYASAHPSANSSLMTLYNNAGGAAASEVTVVRRASDGVMGITAGANSASFGSTVFPLDQWNKVELISTANTSGGNYTLYLNGTSVHNNASVNTGATTFDRFLIGDFASTTQIFWADDISLDTALTGDSSSLYTADSAHVSGTASFGSNVVVKTISDTTKAFQVQNAAGTSIMTADSAGNQLTLGQASSLSGKLTFALSGDSDTITIVSPTSSTSTYSVTLPGAAPAVDKCLKTEAASTTQLEWGNCGTGGGGSLQGAYDTSGTGDPQIVLNGSYGGIEITNASGDGITDLFSVQDFAGTSTFLNVAKTSVLFEAGNNLKALEVVTATGADFHLRVYENDSTAYFVDIYYDKTANEGVITTSSGALAIGGNGTGNVTIPLTSASESFTYSKTLGSLAGAYSTNEFTISRAITGGSQNITGSILNIQDTSTTSGTFTPSIVLLNQASGSSGHLIQAQRGGTDMLLMGIDSNGTYFKTGATSTTAIRMQNASGTNMLVFDTSNNQLEIGVSDTTGTLLILDSQTTSATDPTGVAGGMYYNAQVNKFRCYQNGGWGNCLPTAAAFFDATGDSMTDANSTLWDGTIPNIDIGSTNGKVLVTVDIILRATSNDDEVNAFTIRRAVGSDPTCSSTQIGSTFTTFSTNTDESFTANYAAIDTAVGTAGNVRYIVCSDTAATAGTAVNNTTGYINVVLQELGG